MDEESLLRSVILRRRNLNGEWCAVDVLRNYKICSFHGASHGGVHVHHPAQGEPRHGLAISYEAAYHLANLYASIASSFSWSLLEEVFEQRKSKSKNA